MSGIMGMLLGAKTAIAAAVDEFFNRVTLLLPGDGTNGAQNNTFLDSSSNNFTITRNGNTTQGTFSPFSQTGWSNYFDGNGDYFTLADSTDWVIDTDYTIEFWAYATSFPTQYSNIISQRGGASSYWGLNWDTSTGWGFFWNNGSGETKISRNQNTPLNNWVHVAVVKSGTTGYIFFNGTQAGATFTFGSISDVASLLYIGSWPTPGDYFNGYISNLRLVKGTALYTSNFTPSTTSLTAVTNTKLLTCQSNRFVDNSSNAFTITVNGNTSVQAFSPFAPTAAYSAATVGGSGYFDGTGDYLTWSSGSSIAFGTGDFTVESWLYPTGTGNYYIADARNASQTNTWAFHFTPSTNNVTWFNGSADWSVTASVIVNQWNHIAYVRSGTTGALYLNGTRVSTQTDSTNYSISPTTSYIATRYSAAQLMLGYTADTRILKGTAQYSGTTYTIPTAPLTAITNTQLLLSYTNAGITDATAKNDLETVGNAQISTTQSKFGGSSMYFDGTGDNLVIPSNPNVWLGSGAFSIEMWLYPNDASSQQMLLCGSDSGSIFLGMNIDGANRIALGRKGVAVDNFVSYTYSTGAWIYLAVTRDTSNNVKFFVNGSQVGSTGTNSNSFTNSSLNIGFEPTQKYLNAYIDDLRITKGLARTITASPTAAFPVQ